MTKAQSHTRAISRRLRTVLVGLGLLAAAALIGLDRGVITPYRRRRTLSSSPTAAQDRNRYHGREFTVSRVVDGDTLDIDVPDANTATTQIRLLGIDAPERGRTGVPEMYFAPEATHYARQLAQGTIVTVYLDAEGPTRGMYGRLLAYLELPDGHFLNEQLVAEGYAYADTRFPHSHYHTYRQREASAKALGKGLWAGVTPEQMPAWRRHLSSREPQE